MIALKMLPLIAGEKDMKSDKSVLVIDTPKSCAVCPIFQDGLDGYCPVALSSPYNKYNERDKHCPLKPLPQKIDLEKQDEIDSEKSIDEPYLADKIIESQGYKRTGATSDIYISWNACLSEITGETE